MNCNYIRQDGHFLIKCFKNPQGENYKDKPASSTGPVKRQFNDMNAVDAEEINQFKAWRDIQGKDGYNPPTSHKGE